MGYALLAAVALVLVVLGARYFTQASPARVAVVLRSTAAGLLMLLAVFLALRGFLFIAAPIFLVGLGLLRGSSFGFPWGQRSAGQKSEVRTSLLAMQLDHDTGAVDGEVIAGPHAGRRLSDFDLDELRRLLEECRAVPDQSATLLEAYLDHAHPDWRDGEEEPHAERAQAGGPRRGSSAMTVEEARAVLGVGADASDEEIRAAHRRLMKISHPDHGGTDYLAAKINQAKDLLLGKRAR